jgi:hypothetical protein
MTLLTRISLFATLVAAPLAAQQPAAAAGPQCPVDLNQPKDLITLYNITRPRAITLQPGAERTKVIQDIFKSLGNPKTVAANPLGTNLFAGQMLILWAMTPGQGPTATRGQMNWGEPKDQVIDLVKVADSLFTTVEATSPACFGETKPWRMAKPWQDRINAAFKAVAANQADSAEYWAKQSLVLERWSPYAERVFAAAAQQRGSQSDMLTHLQAALKLTEGDTAYAEDRRAVQFQIGQAGLEYAEIQPEPKRTETLRMATNTLLQLVTESPSAETTPYALSGIGMAAMSLKDSSLYVKCFDLVDKAIDKFSDMSALQAAICANRNGKSADAARMFELTLAKNPYSRDALYNEAALLYEMRKGKEMVPVVTRLLAIDPNNPDNISLYAYAYNVLNEQANKTAAEAALAAAAANPAPAAPKPAPGKPGAKPAPKPVVVAPPPPPPSPFADSVQKYMKASDDMREKVTITEFNRYSDRAELKGEIENRTKAARSFEIEVEFLDLTGAVLDKMTAKVENVAASGTGTFSVKSPKPKIAAWRYAPIK